VQDRTGQEQSFKNATDHVKPEYIYFVVGAKKALATVNAGPQLKHQPLTVRVNE
jgi:hypothetical protein